jgi:hypothetical protein
MKFLPHLKTLSLHVKHMKLIMYEFFFSPLALIPFQKTFTWMLGLVPEFKMGWDNDF